MATFSEMSQKNSNKNASDFELRSYLKKKSQNATQLPPTSDSINPKSHKISLCINSFSKLLLETGVYIASLKKSEAPICRANKCLNGKPCDISRCNFGDRVLSINGITLRNKPIHDIFELFRNCQYFDLVIQKDQIVGSSSFIDLTRSQSRSLVESASENHSYLNKSPSHHPNSSRQQQILQEHLFDSNESLKFFDSKGNLIPIVNDKNKHFNPNQKKIRPPNAMKAYSNENV